LQERSVQLQLQLLQKQLDRKATELGCLQTQLPGLHAELGIMTKAKEVNAQVSCKTTVLDCFSQVVHTAPANFTLSGLGVLLCYGYVCWLFQLCLLAVSALSDGCFSFV